MRTQAHAAAAHGCRAAMARAEWVLGSPRAAAACSSRPESAARGGLAAVMRRARAGASARRRGKRPRGAGESGAVVAPPCRPPALKLAFSSSPARMPAVCKREVQKARCDSQPPDVIFKVVGQRVLFVGAGAKASSSPAL